MAQNPFVAADTLEVTEHQVTASPAWETTPNLGNDGVSNLVVYTSRELLPGPSLGPGDIYYRRLNDTGAPSGPAVQVSSGNETDDQLNDVSGDYIVWTSYETGGFNGNITLYQISTGIRLPLRSADIIKEARIAGHVVVWIEGNASGMQVMLYDLAWLGTATDPLRLAGPLPPTYQVEIGERCVVWAEFESGQYDVKAYDCNAAPAFAHLTITNTSATSETEPATSGSWIVWQAQEIGNATSRIEAYNVDTTDFLTLSDPGVGLYCPTIHGDLITYESNRTGNLDVYVFRLSTAETFQVTTNTNDQYLNDVLDDLVAYVDPRNGNEDIYVSHLTFNHHYIAISQVALSKTVVGQGYPVSIDVTIWNGGTVTEAVNVTVFARAEGSRDGLTEYWSFNEDNGTIAYDWSVNTHDGSITGAAWTTGKMGSALHFDGVDDHVTAPFIPLYNQSFTVMMWVKAIGFPTVTDAALLTQAHNNSVGQHLHLVVRDELPYFGFWNDDLTGNTALSPDRWYHLAFAYSNATNRKYIIVDGEVDIEGDSGGAYQGTSGDTIVGAYSGGYDVFNGTIDEVRVYDRVLSLTEIRSVMSSGILHTQNVTVPISSVLIVPFLWDTTGVGYGNYTIVALASPVPGETETADNILFDGWVIVSIPGDVDGDRDVDVGDQRKVQLAMFSHPGDPNWNPNMDIDGDLDVDVGDQRKQQLHMFESW